MRNLVLKIGVATVLVLCACLLAPGLSLATDKPFDIAASHESLCDLQSTADFTISLKLLNAGTGCRTSSFKAGDLMALQFKIPQSGYLWVFNVDMDGCVHMLYPNTWQPDNYVRANTWHTLGDDCSDFSWRAQACRKAQECIVAVLATDRDDFLDRFSCKSNPGGFDSLDTSFSDLLELHTKSFITEPAQHCKYGFGYQHVMLTP